MIACKHGFFFHFPANVEVETLFHPKYLKSSDEISFVLRAPPYLFLHVPCHQKWSNGPANSVEA